METISRDQLKKIFKKVKKLHLPGNLETIGFVGLSYFSWPDESSQCLYLVTQYRGSTAGLKLNFIKAGSGPLRLGFCEFCHKHRRSQEVLFVSTETRRRPKNINYRVRGTWICADYLRCNGDMKNDSLVQDFFYRILDQV